MRGTQLVAEYFNTLPQIQRATQLAVEYLKGTNTVTRSTQLIVEYLTAYPLVPIPPELPCPPSNAQGTPNLKCIACLPIKRQREVSFISDDNIWMFHRDFTLDLETGLGLTRGQGSDPELILEWSNNSGHTWSNEHRISAGRQGQYTWRAMWTRLGRARTRTYRVTVSDPIKWAFVDAYITLEKGTS